jgi:hypothetical protein
LQRVESRGCILRAGRIAKKRTITVGGVEAASRVAKEGERSISRVAGTSSVA